MPDLNPRAVMGANTKPEIDYAREESERLAGEYAALADTAVTLEQEAGLIPDEIPDEPVKAKVVDLIKRIRDTKVRIEAIHGVEKQPHLRRGQGVDQFFFGLWDRLLKRSKTARDGIGDDLGKRLTAYDTRVLLAEQERRRKAAEEAMRIAAAAEAERIRTEQEAEAARLAAERARKPETTAAKTEVANQADTLASEARIDATIAERAAEDLHVETLARPADIMRTRTAAGTLSTMATETYAEIEDATKLDAAALWAYVPFAAKQTALNAWAKGTDYRGTMPGAKIGRRPKSTVR